MENKSNIKKSVTQLIIVLIALFFVVVAAILIADQESMKEQKASDKETKLYNDTMKKYEEYLNNLDSMSENGEVRLIDSDEVEKIDSMDSAVSTQIGGSNE